MMRITHGGTAPALRSPKLSNMSVLVLFKWEGDPDELLAVYDRELEHPVPASSLSTYLTPVRESTMAW